MSPDRHARAMLPIPGRPYESGTTVSPDYTAQNSRFTGRINWVQLDVGTADSDHFIDPDERLRVVMARQ